MKQHREEDGKPKRKREKRSKGIKKNGRKRPNIAVTENQPRGSDADMERSSWEQREKNGNGWKPSFLKKKPGCSTSRSTRKWKEAEGHLKTFDKYRKGKKNLRAIAKKKKRGKAASRGAWCPGSELIQRQKKKERPLQEGHKKSDAFRRWYRKKERGGERVAIAKKRRARVARIKNYQNKKASEARKKKEKKAQKGKMTGFRGGKKGGKKRVGEGSLSSGRSGGKSRL